MKYFKMITLLITILLSRGYYVNADCNSVSGEIDTDCLITDDIYNCIETDAYVKDQSDVWFRAANSITLEPGFKVETGSSVHLVISTDDEDPIVNAAFPNDPQLSQPIISLTKVPGASGTTDGIWITFYFEDNPGGDGIYLAELYDSGGGKLTPYLVTNNKLIFILTNPSPGDYQYTLKLTDNAGNVLDPSFTINFTVSDEYLMKYYGFDGGGRFTAVAVNPFDSDMVLIGSDVAGIFRSIDGGANFALSGNSLNSFNVTDIAFDPDPNVKGRIYALTQGGLYQSDDFGENWYKISADITNNSRPIGNHAILFKDANSLWVATETNGVFEVPREPIDLQSPLVGGIIDMDKPSGTSKIHDLAIFENKLYAATDEGVYYYDNSSWWLFCTNEGDISELIECNGKFYSVEKENGLYVYDQTNSIWDDSIQENLEYNYYNGDSWFSQHDDPDAYKALACHSNVLFMATNPVDNWPHYLFRTSDGGSTWNLVDSFISSSNNFNVNRVTSPDYWYEEAESYFRAIEEISGINSNDLYLTDWWNVWKSYDNGSTWEQLYNGLQNTVINDILIDNGTIYVCAGDVGLVYSGNGGTSWTRQELVVSDDFENEEIYFPNYPPNDAIKIEFLNNTIYLLLDEVIDVWRDNYNKIWIYKYEYENDNWTWKSFTRPQNYQATSMKVDPTNANIVYVATNGGGIYKTTNGGDDWVNIGLSGLAIQGSNALLFHPTDHNTIFVSTSNGIYQSIDGGDNWNDIDPAYNSVTFGMTFVPDSGSYKLIAGAYNGEIRIGEYDNGWTWASEFLPSCNSMVWAVSYNPDHTNQVLAGTVAIDDGPSDGLYFRDYQQDNSYSQIPIDLPLSSVYDICWFANTADDEALIGFRGIGVHYIKIQ